MPGLSVVPSDLSQLGIKVESTFGTDPGAPYRGLLVTNFESNLIVDSSPFKKISGIKGDFALNRSGEHWEISFTICGASSADTSGSVGDILAMIYDQDSVAGVGPYTHTFSLPSPAIVQKKSWTIYREDLSDSGNNTVFKGFVVNEVVFNIDKTTGIISIDVSGLAQNEDNTIADSTNNYENLTIWTPANAKLTIAGEQVDFYNTIAITHSMNTEAFNTINDTSIPLLINGTTQDLSVELSGFYGIAGTNNPESLRDIFLAHSEESSTINIIMGSSAVDDLFTLTIPSWAIEAEQDKTLEPDTQLPQTLTIRSITKGLLGNTHSTDLLTNVATPFTSI